MAISLWIVNEVLFFSLNVDFFIQGYSFPLFIYVCCVRYQGYTGCNWTTHVHGRVIVQPYHRLSAFQQKYLHI